MTVKLSVQWLVELGHWNGHFQVLLGKFVPYKLEVLSVSPRTQAWGSVLRILEQMRLRQEDLGNPSS